MFVLKFLLEGSRQVAEREKFQHDSYKLSLTSIQEDPDSLNENHADGSSVAVGDFTIKKYFKLLSSRIDQLEEDMRL